MVSRRTFLRDAGLSSLFFSAGYPAMSEINRTNSLKRILKPYRLKEGDTVGLISPSGAVYESEPYEIAIESLQKLGLQVKMSSHVYDRYGHLAGKDEDRAAEINEMFLDEEVKAIFCLRGGSGAARILDLIDYKAIADNPKILIGYSDITAFLLAIYAKTGLITFHGLVATSEWNDFTLKYVREILFEGKASLFKNPSKKEDEWVQHEDRIRTITSGSASGILAGGNLAVLTGIVGSQYLPDWKGKILFIEEVGESIHRIDRMMSQLQLAGILSEISGFVLGKCTKCRAEKGYGSLTLEEVIDHYIKPLNIPAYSGAMIGHISEKFTIPVGIEATMDADKGTIQLNEAATL